ncbi:hypothetical protein ACHAXT_009357 [Thalassiosira profunda]
MRWCRRAIPDEDDTNEKDKQEDAKDESDATTNISKRSDDKSKPNILQMINPFQAGKNLRSGLDSALDLASAITNDPAQRLPPERRALYYNYYLDDQLGLGLELRDDTKIDTAPAPSWMTSPDEDYRPEVLVVGAAGALGNVLVKRLLIESKVRVRVLVRDLYSSTLNKLGTGVTYCQGDLNDMESLEYAVTDVDKIVFCAGVNRELGTTGGKDEGNWNKLGSVLDQRSKDAAMIDGVGLRNLIHAYQNVRYADYGNSQAAKRTLFKFRKRPADFGLFGIDNGTVDGTSSDDDGSSDAANGYPGDVAAAIAQSEWKTNKFGHAYWAGKVDRYGEAAIASARLRSRNDPEKGMDLRSGGFAGIVCRVCSDGGVYEAFFRTEAYERLGVEYACEFKTSAKSPKDGSENTSRTKWSTVRLAFRDFRPRMRQFQATADEDAQRMRQALGQSDIPAFTGRDIRQLGFRYRGKNNPFSSGGSAGSGWSKFYLALDYIKVYRGQPEPEFVYLSDARIPPVVNDWMVKHDLHRLVTSSSESRDSYSIIDEEEAKQDILDRSSEETYYKYMGEEMIRQSGLSYTIIRVVGYNADRSTDSSAVRLQKMNKDITSVSRADLAQVISSALLEPNACNLVLYMTKAQSGERKVLDGDLWQKFKRLQSETAFQ